MLRAFARLRSWPVTTVAAAVATGDDVAFFGPIDHPFALASVTKLATALAVLVAAEETTVDLDAALAWPAAAFAPLSGADVGQADPMTVEFSAADLLAHAAGLAPDAVAQPDGRAAVRPLASPGRRRIYSNAGYELVAAAAAEGSGLPFADYLREAVLEPLGMGATALSGSPAAALTSTVRDVARLLRELRRPRLLAPATHARLLRPHRPGLAGVVPGVGRFADNAWGLGPEIRAAKWPHWTGPRNSPATVGHFGRSGTFLWWDPVPDRGAIVLTDRPFGPWALAAWPAFSDAVIDG